MRSLILILATIVVLGGGLALYTWMQPAGPAKSSRSSIATTRQRPEAGPRMRGVGEGKSPWARTFDEDTGELKSQFRAFKWDPQSDDTVDVEGPDAEFFTSDGKQRIRIEGKTGNVVVPPNAQHEDPKLQGGSMEMPSRGKLHDVTVSVFEPVDAAEPMLTARMNNAAFDTDTFRIATESFTDASGKTIEADQVPVVVRGRDYDFDGRGLVIRWNQRDRKLQLLEIAHGESLVVKNPDVLEGSAIVPTTQQSARPLVDEFASTADVVPLPSTTQSPRRRRHPATITATAPATTTSAATKPREPPVVYRATFERDVRILKGADEIAALEQMTIDTLQESKESPATQPATARATSPRKRVAATTQSTQPTTQGGPITVKWTGKLRVVPLDAPPDPMPLPGKAIVRMFGSPAIIKQKTGEAHCGKLVFNSADSSAWLLPSDKVPMVTLDSEGAKVSTPKLQYVGLEGDHAVANLVGKSSAEIPVENEKTGKSEILKANWSKDGKLTFKRPSAGGDPVITQANLNGDVAVAHPQMKMKSQQLEMSFDPEKAAAPQAPVTTKRVQMASSLKMLVATGNVDCDFPDEKNPRTMKAQRLQVEPQRHDPPQADGWLIHAAGDVVSHDKDGEMKAGRLAAQLTPSTQPDGEMRPEWIDAEEGVTLTSGKTVATANELHGRTDGDVLTYTLVGKPDAKVVSDTSTLIGPQIVVQPDRNIAQILGAGSADGINPDNTKQKIHITWAGDANVDGNRDLIDIKTGVVVKSSEENTTSTANAERLVAKLTPKPAKGDAQPTSKKGSETSSLNFLNNKEITAGTLTGKVTITSEQTAADGKLETSMDLFAEHVDYDQKTGRLDVPVPGRMLYRDVRPPDKDQTKGPTLGSGRGATAFLWSKSLVYDQPRLQATMNGDVKVVHQPDNEKDQPFTLTAQTLTATFEPKKQNATVPAAAPAPAGPGAMKELQPRTVVASGDVHVSSAKLNFDAPQMTFDMQQQILTATGDQDHPITVFDAEKGSTQTASKIFWNTKTDEVRIEGMTAKVRR